MNRFYFLADHIIYTYSTMTTIRNFVQTETNEKLFLPETVDAEAAAAAAVILKKAAEAKC